MRTYVYIYEIAILLGSIALLWALWSLWWWHTNPSTPQVWIAKPDDIEVDLVRDTAEDVRCKLRRVRSDP